jgi:hypothetical protein
VHVKWRGMGGQGGEGERRRREPPLPRVSEKTCFSVDRFFDELKTIGLVPSNRKHVERNLKIQQ